MIHDLCSLVPTQGHGEAEATYTCPDVTASSQENIGNSENFVLCEIMYL